MSKVKKVNLSFTASGSPDVVGYRLYVEEHANPVTFSSQSWDIGNVTEINIAELDGMTTKDGIYNIGVVAIDDAGNESSMSILEGVAFDFVAPDPPGKIVITRS